MKTQKNKKKYLEFPNFKLNLARSQIHIQNKICIISKNIEHPSKFDKIDSLFNRTDILLLQEVNMFNKTKKKDFQRLLKLHNFTSYSSDSPRAAIAIKNSKTFKLVESSWITNTIAPDLQAFIADVTLSIPEKSENWLIISIYAPKPNRQLQYFEEINNAINTFVDRYHTSNNPNFTSRELRIVIGGDFNNILDEHLDKIFTSQLSLIHESTDPNIKNLVEEILSDHQLFDAFRYIVPDIPHTTNKNYRTNRRLDRIYISRCLSPTLVQFVQISNDMTSTHDTIGVHLLKNTKPKITLGPPRFICPPDIISQPHLIQPLVNSQQQEWDSFIHLVEPYCIHLQTAIKKLADLEIEVLLKNQPKNNSFYPELNYKFKGPSHSQNIIEHISNSSNTEQVNTTGSILRVATEYFEKLFQPPQNTASDDLMEEFIRELPQISENQKSDLEKPFTLNDLHASLKRCKTDAAPGSDGITIRFLKASTQFTAPMILKIANNMKNDGIIPDSMKTILITLIPKRTKFSSTNIKDFRPILLINSSVRLISSMVNQRLLQIVDTIIGPNQRGFLTHRQMDENIAEFRYLTSIIQNQLTNDSDPELQQFTKESSILLLDFSKAFDRVSHSFLTRVLSKINIGPSFIRIINTIVTNQWALLYINRTYGRKFKLASGTPQGNPFSPTLFILTLEPFLVNLQKRLTGIKISIPFLSGIYVKYAAFADDVNIYMNTKEDAPILKTIISQYQEVSNGLVNSEKSIIYHFNKDETSTIHHILQFPYRHYASETITYLGVQNKGVDWIKQIQNFRYLISNLLISSLPYALKAIGINTYLLSKLYFRDLHSPMTDQEITKMHTMIKTFFPRITKTILFTLPIHGGYGLIDLKLQLKGRRAKIIYNLFFDKTNWFYSNIRAKLQLVANEIVDNASILADSERNTTLYATVHWGHLLVSIIPLKTIPTTTYDAGRRKGKKKPLKEVLLSHPALSSEKLYLEAWFNLLSFHPTREKPQIFSSETISEWITNPDPTFLQLVRDPRNKPLDKDISFAHLNQVIKKRTEPIFSAENELLPTPAKRKAFWAHLWRLACQIPKSTEVLHLYYLGRFPQNLSLQQASIETVSDRTLDRARCLLCHNEIYKADFTYHLVGVCRVTEKIWDQLDLEYYDNQLNQTDIRHLKMNQYLHCCYRIYRLRLAQSDESIDLSDETVSNWVRYFTTYGGI